MDEQKLKQKKNKGRLAILDLLIGVSFCVWFLALGYWLITSKFSFPIEHSSAFLISTLVMFVLLAIDEHLIKISYVKVIYFPLIDREKQPLTAEAATICSDLFDKVGYKESLHGFSYAKKIIDLSVKYPELDSKLFRFSKIYLPKLQKCYSDLEKAKYDNYSLQKLQETSELAFKNLYTKLVNDICKTWRLNIADFEESCAKGKALEIPESVCNGSSTKH